MSIYRRLLLSFAAVIIIFSLILIAVSSVYTVNELSDERREIALDGIRNSIDQNTFLFFASDKTKIEEWLSTIVSNDSVKYASILNKDFEVNYFIDSIGDGPIEKPESTRIKTFSTDEFINIVGNLGLDTEIDQSNNVYFHIVLESNRLAIFKKVLAEVASILLIIFLLIWPLLVFISKRVSKPMVDLSKQIENVRPEKVGGMHINISDKSPTEIELFVNTFNALLVRLQDYTENLDTKVKERTILLNEAMFLAQENEKQKQTMIANLSHDLKTPLASIRGYLEIIHEQLTFDELVSAMDNIPKAISSADAMLGEINELLHISSSKHFSSLLTKQRVHLKRACLAIIDKHKLLSSNSNNTLNFSFNGPDHAVIHLSTTIHVLDNLLSNANKYSNNCTISIKVDVGSNVVISVSDQGNGLSESEIKTLFNTPKIDASNSNNLSGLGLFLCKKRIEMIGGSIHARNQKPKGLIVEYSTPNKDS